MKTKTFRDLKVWRKAHELTLEIYRITKIFPDEERFGLVSQLRRSSSSVATNLVEGYKRRGKKDFARFVNVAEGSLEETKYSVLLSFDLNYLKEDEFSRLNLLCDEVGKMLTGLYKKLTT